MAFQSALKARWLWYSLACALCWAGWTLLSKLGSREIIHGRTVFAYSKSNIAWALLGGLLNTLGAWALFAALKCGGKASVVVPLTTLYPLLAILLVPLMFHESITLLQVFGILCSLIAVVLLSSETDGTEVTRDSVFPEALP